MKDYREIRPEYTVDRFTDGQAPTANINSFQRLINFIPKSGRIATRFGIQEFAHTPDTTGDVWTPEVLPPGSEITLSAGDPLDFAVIQAIFKFDTQATIGTNVLDGTVVYSPQISVAYNGGAYVDESEKIQGTASLNMGNDTASNSSAGNPARNYGLRTSNDFPSWMPGNHSAPYTQKIMVMYWLKPRYASPAANAEWHMGFGNRNDGKQPFYIRHFDTGLQWAVANSAGGSSTWGGGINLIQDQWQFISVWHDFTTGFRGQYWYDPVLLNEVYSSGETAPNNNHYYTSSSYNTINAHMLWDAGAGTFRCDDSDAYHGWFDYLTFWSRPMHIANTSNITLSRLFALATWMT